MRQVIFSKKGAEIDFNGFFYPKKLLEEAARQLSEVCKSNIEERKPDRILVRLEGRQGFPLREAAFAFCNHALALRQGWD